MTTCYPVRPPKNRNIEVWRLAIAHTLQTLCLFELLRPIDGARKPK